MALKTIHLLLADDDNDDCLLFEEALNELSLPVHLTVMHDGEQLMRYLNHTTTSQLPVALFLDLNLPRKNGFECLAEIRNNKRLSHLRVIIYSTSAELDYVNLLYENGANYYIRKPNQYAQLKKVLQQVLTIILERKVEQPPKEDFVITG
jgi:CheY-like chemotaxis protein